MTTCESIAVLFFGTKVALSTSWFLHRWLNTSSAAGTHLYGHVRVTLLSRCSTHSLSQ